MSVSIIKLNEKPLLNFREDSDKCVQKTGRKSVFQLRLPGACCCGETTTSPYPSPNTFALFDLHPHMFSLPTSLLYLKNMPEPLQKFILSKNNGISRLKHFLAKIMK